MFRCFSNVYNICIFWFVTKAYNIKKKNEIVFRHFPSIESLLTLKINIRNIDFTLNIDHMFQRKKKNTPQFLKYKYTTGTEKVYNI